MIATDFARKLGVAFLQRAPITVRGFEVEAATTSGRLEVTSRWSRPDRTESERLAKC